MLNEKLYTVSDVANLTGMTDRTIRNYLKDGTLRGRKIGVQWRFTEDDIRQLFREYSLTPAFSEHDNAAVTELLEHQASGTIAVTKIDGITSGQTQELYRSLRGQSSNVQIICQYEETRASARFIFSGPGAETAQLLRYLDTQTSHKTGQDPAGVTAMTTKTTD